MLLPDGSFQEWFRSRFGQERALHRSYRSLDRLGRLRFVSCCVAGLVRPLRRPRPLLVCWLGAIFNVNKVSMAAVVAVHFVVTAAHDDTIKVVTPYFSHLSQIHSRPCLFRCEKFLVKMSYQMFSAMSEGVSDTNKKLIT
jgi:hypothetical protein